MSGWVSVREKMPKDHQDVLFTNGKNVMFGAYDSFTEYWYEWDGPYDTEHYYGDPITHWMPLPEPPKEDV